MKKLALLIVPILLLSGCSFFRETWQGFYYPNGCLVCQDDYIYSPLFNDRASCLAWASDLKAGRGNPSDKYECGKNCKTPDYKEGLYVCDETVDY